MVSAIEAIICFQMIQCTGEAHKSCHLINVCHQVHRRFRQYYLEIMSLPVVHDDSEELVKTLKKCLKPYKSQIKANTERNRRFAFVKLDKCSHLDKWTQHFISNDNHVDEHLDRKLKKITKKLYRSTRKRDSTEEEPVKKKPKVSNTLIDFNSINNENEDLDFEDGSDSGSGDKKISDKKSRPKQVNGSISKLNGHSATNSFDRTKENRNGLPLYSNNLNQTFKIPKKSAENIETILSHVNSLIKRPSEAFNHLNKHLADDQWSREDVIESLVNIAKNMVIKKDFGGHLNVFNELVNKLKSLKYIENEFWDDLIFVIDKKKGELKNTHVRQSQLQ